jgi:hypothetical protein
MSRTYRALTTLALSLALVGTTAAVATAAEDVNAQRKALYQAELAHNLKARTAAPAEDQNDRLLGGIEAAQAERSQAAVEQARAGERNLGPVPVVTVTPQPVPAGRDVDLVAIALLALVGGLIGGAAATAGWAAASRRRHRVVAA